MRPCTIDLMRFSLIALIKGSIIEVVLYEGALVHNYFRKWSCFSGRRTNQEERSKRVGTVYEEAFFKMIALHRTID